MSSDGREFLVVLATVAGILLVLGVGFLALRTGTTEIQHRPGVTLGHPEDYGSEGSSTALVTAKTQSGGRSLFGISFGKVTYRISAQFFTPPGCFSLVESGDQWPTPFLECSTAVDVEGTVTGLGRAQTAETIVVVDLEVTKDCFQNVSVGGWWPPGIDSCLPDE